MGIKTFEGPGNYVDCLSAKSIFHELLDLCFLMIRKCSNCCFRKIQHNSYTIKQTDMKDNDLHNHEYNLITIGRST